MNDSQIAEVVRVLLMRHARPLDVPITNTFYVVSEDPGEGHEVKHHLWFSLDAALDSLATIEHTRKKLHRVDMDAWEVR